MKQQKNKIRPSQSKERRTSKVQVQEQVLPIAIRDKLNLFRIEN